MPSALGFSDSQQSAVRGSAAGFGSIGGAVTDLFSSQATASGLRLKARGDLAEATNYDSAAVLARQNEQFTEQSTAIKQQQQTRETELGLGTTTADVSGAGFSMSGSALDLMRSGAQQGALAHQVLGEQGLITEAGYNQQAESFSTMANAARDAAASEESSAKKSALGGDIGAALKGAAAIAQFAAI